MKDILSQTNEENCRPCQKDPNGGKIQTQSLKAEWISRAHLLRGMSNLNVKARLLFVHYCNEGQIEVRAKSFRYFLCTKNSDVVRVHSQ